MKKIVAQIKVGSHLYGLATEKSDIDIRQIHVLDKYEDILGLSHDNSTIITSKDIGSNTETVGYELRHFLSLLRRTNSTCLEVLFADRGEFSILDPKFETLVLNNRKRFIDTFSFYKTLLNYMMYEKARATDMRKAAGDSKYADTYVKYGFNPKCFINTLRLGYCGETFLITGHYPTNIEKANPTLADMLKKLKAEPEKYTKEELLEMAAVLEKNINASFAAIKPEDKLIYDTDYANEVLLRFYFPVISKAHAEKDI